MKTLELRKVEGPFSEAAITHADIADFASESVNLSRVDAEEYRDQVRRLREKLDRYAADHRDYGLIKTLLSGSLANKISINCCGVTNRLIQHIHHLWQIFDNIRLKHNFMVV